MASGEQLIEDLFGFEELTGENVSPSSTAGAARKVIGTKIEVSPKYLLEKEKIKRDTDELIIPIISEKSGVKKYKVLARHQVEDDEDIRRPGSSERASPNSEEQRKENINIKQKCDHPQKQKLDDKKNVKRHKIKCIEKTGEHSLKRLKQSLNVRRPTSKLDKVKNRKHDQQKVKGDKTREKRLSTCIGKDPREVNYEFNVDFDTNNELLNQKHKTGEEPGSEKREECDTSIKSIRTQESFEGKNLEKEQVKQSQFKVKCHVKLKRDPSIESLYKALSDSDSKDSTSVLSLSESVSTSHLDKSSARCSSELSSYSDSDQINMLSRQSSCEEKAKLVDMVYNADIQVRKSGRLQSAKCASRYRGDYGIRVDTYKQLVGKTLNTDGANGSTGSENRKFDEQFYCEDIEAALIGKPKTVIGVDNITSPQVMSRLSENEDETVASKSNISAEVCKSDIYSGEFTVLKVPAIDCSAAVTDISLKESCPGTEYLVEQEIFEKGTIDKEIDSSDGVSDVKKYTDGMNKGDSHPYEKIENSLTESYANVNSIVGNKKDQLAESHMLVTESAKNDQQGCSEFNDQYRCEHKMETENSHEKSDSCRSATETACHNISDEVPCVNRTVEREPCVSECCTNKTIVGNTRTDFSVSKEKWDSGTSNQVSTEVQTDRKCLKSFESKIAKEKINKRLEALQNKVTDTSTERGGYVHSVGKSVNKIQKRMEIKRPVSGIRQEKINNEIPSVTSPVKDAAKVLENLRQKLFESAGADAVEADKFPKQFESKLISSKQRKNTDNKVPFIEDICEQDSQIKECDSASNKSGKSTPKCSTPRSEAGREILEEVAKSLDLLQKAKRKSKSKERPLKRRRFEEKKFLLRSMIKDNEQGADSEVQKPEIEVDSHSCESNSSNACSVSTTDSVERSCVKKSLEETAEKQVSKQKPVKCSACSHIFKTKELLRKHFPCRIRQTRTWSQNKLRPNRAVKRVENSSKKFVCKLPKSCKSETNISRPQLLTYRKTKFRRVKGKRRRRLYQLIQDLRQKRMPVKWPHLSIMYEDLSFKEQCLYKLGLICIGSAAEGLEKYTAEEITVFEQHRAKERWITEDARLFEHSIPEFLKPFSDLNLSTATELSTDNQESDFNSPKSVINLPQENTTDTSCDIQTSVEEKTEGSNTEMSEVEVCEKSTLELTGASAVPNVSSSKDKEVPWCLSYIQNLGQFQMNNNDEEALALDEIPAKMKAIVSIQQPLECFRNLRKDDQRSVEVGSGVEICKRFQTVSQLQTLTSTSESSVNVEEAEELPNIMENTTSVKTDLVVNLFEKADVKEIEVCATDASSPESSSQVVEEYNQQELIKLNDEEMMSSSSLGNNSLTSNEDVNDASKLLKDDSYQGLQTVPDVNEIKSPSVLVTEHLSQDVFEKSSTSLEECVAKKELNEIDSEVSDQNTLIADNPVRTDCDVTGQEPMKNYYLKQKVNVGPDIERFHQTAIIDDKILESGPYAQLERASGKDTVSSVLKSEINNDLITQAGRVLEDILEDVNATVNGGKNGHVQIGQKSPSSTSVTANRMTSSTNETTDISPVKGILKKACQVKESLASSPLKTASTIDQVNENSFKSPGKKKIDFKTYAKRKGMIKEKDDKEKEYMRSESNHEIEEGLLGRLLDAVNVIDSIIEEHKEKTEPDDECFNAITPEMAFEAALLSCKRESCMEEENKPYDIESVFPHSEVDDIVDVEQMPITTSIDFSRNVNFTDKVMQSEGISCYVEDDRNMTIDSEHKSDLLSKEDDSITESNHSNNYHVTESYSGKNIDNIKENIYVANEENLAVSTASLSLVNGDGQQLQESTEPDTSEMDSENDSDVSGIKGNSLDFDSGADLEYEGKVEKDTGEPNVIKCSEVNVSGSTSDSLEVLVTSPSLLLNEDKHYVEEKVQVSEKVTNGAKHIFIVKENDSAEIMTEDISEKMKNTESKMPSSVDTEIGLLDVQPDTIENSREEFCEILKVVDAETKSKSFEEGALVESPTSTDTDIIKSPGHIPKRCKKTTQATNIKESKKDFTIKYEINGIVVKENLLTGDKNVVENSSPFRSSAESDSNFDQSSQSELDVSFAIENDSGFDRNAVVNDKGSFQNTTVAPSTVYNPVAVVNDAVADEEQHTDNEDFHKLSDEVTVEVGENDTTNEKKCLEDEAENKMSKGIELTVRFSSNMENETFETGVNAEMTSDIIPSIETEKLPCENVHVVKVFDDHSVGSPPVLEKVADSSIEEFDEESCSQDTDISLESGPPILEPQGEEENEKKCGDESQVKTSQKTKSERHFLDVLGVVGSEIEGETAFQSFEKKIHLGRMDNDGSSGKSILEKLYTEESAVNDSIGRHFSDVVSETVEVPKTPKSKLLFLFDKSETKEVTLSQIKDILTPFSKTGKETSIPKESLLKIQSGIANLLAKVKKPVKKDPSWLKRNPLSGYSREKKQQEKCNSEREINRKNESSDEEILSEQEDIDYTSSESILSSDRNADTENIETGAKTSSEVSVADTILQMLTTLEDKGSIAENMSNLLDILAENLGFLGRRKSNDEFDSSSESDYDYSDTGEVVVASGSSSTENTQKELITGYLDEGEQPPSLDDIPTAGNCSPSVDKEEFDLLCEDNDLISEKIEKEKMCSSELSMVIPEGSNAELDSLGAWLDQLPSGFKTNSVKGKPSHTDTGDVNFVSESKLAKNVNEKAMDLQISVDETLPIAEVVENKISAIERNWSFSSFDQFEEVTQINDLGNEEKRKASTIFKSITELNSIETDEESNSGETYDAVSMSVRLSELKALPKNNQSWEFDSDFNSDQDEYDKTDSDFETEKAEPPEHSKEVHEVHELKENALYECVSETQSAVEASEEIKETLTSNMITSDKENFGNQKSGINKTSKQVDINIRSESGNQPVDINRNTPVEDTELSFEDLPLCKALRKGADASDGITLKDSKNVENIEHTQICQSSAKENYFKEEQQIAEYDQPSVNRIQDNIFSRVIPTAENGEYSDHSDDKEDFVSKDSSSTRDGASLGDTGEKEQQSFKTQTDSEYLNLLNAEKEDIFLTSETKTSESVLEYKENSASGKGTTDVDNKVEKLEKTAAPNDSNFIEDQLSKSVVNNHLNSPDLNSLDIELNIGKIAENSESSNTDSGLNLRTENKIDNKNTDSIPADSFDSVISLDNEDSNETVAYDELEEAKTDFTDIFEEVNKETLSAANVEVGSINKECDRNGMGVHEKCSENGTVRVNISESDVPITVKHEKRKHNGSVSNNLKEKENVSNVTEKQDRQMEESDMCTSKKKPGNKQLSTSISVDSGDVSESFCETIAEKVKRKQRDRSKSYCYSFNPWLYCSAAYVRDVTKPAKKEISVFRSSILEKRARERVISPDKEETCSPRKIRNGSVQKEDLSINGSAGTCTNDGKSSSVQKVPCEVKPCAVVLPKLTEDMIKRYTSRKRKSDEDLPSEHRPPIKVTIKLSQIVYPPNSPYGSTSVSSDTGRSGYESCSEESGSETNVLEEEEELDSVEQMKVDNDVIDMKDLNRDSINGVNAKRSDNSHRAPLKIKMRTLLTKMNSFEKCVDQQNSVQETDHTVPMPVNMNESSSETNIDVSSGELIESEVLHDIKQECEKVKTSDSDVLFYISDSENEPDAAKETSNLSENIETTDQDEVKLGSLSDSHVIASCGESDVDLSDSDTESDSEIQEEIDKILNAKSSDVLCDSVQHEEADNTKMGKGKSGIMKMIVSDLRLSESESESEADESECKQNFVTEGVTKGIVDSQTNSVFLHSNGKAEIACLTNVESWPHDTETGFQIEDEIENVKGENIQNTSSGLLKENSSEEPSSENSYSNISLVATSRKNEEPCYSSVERNSLEKKDSETENIFELLDLSKNSQVPASCESNTVPITVSEKEMTGITQKPLTNDLTCSEHNQLLSSVDKEDIGSILKNQLPPENCDLSFDKESGNMSLDNFTSIEDSVSFSSRDDYQIEKVIEKYPDELGNQISSQMPGQLLSVNVADSESKADVSSLELCIHEANEEQITVEDSSCTINVSSIGNDIRHSNSTKECEILEDSLTLDERKDLENANAVKNLVGDTFENLHQVQESTKEDMFYYAVELSDDLETSEAVVNLESVIIKSPVIAEDTEICEENIVNSSFIQSHVNSQFDLQTEPLNEQIVEIGNDNKLVSELKEKDSQERMTHMENPFYYPVVSDVNSKYLYGINEDSQSSDDVVEELVTDIIVNDNADLKQMDQPMNIEDKEVFQQGSIVESSNIKFPRDLTVRDVPSHSQGSVINMKATDLCAELSEGPMDVETSCVECNVNSESEHSNEEIEKETVLNISENLNTLMCSGSVPVDKVDICTGVSDTETSRLSINKDGNSFLQENEQCEIVVECNDENDYIITQNEFFDDDNIMDIT